MKIRTFTALWLGLATAGIAAGANARVFNDCVKDFPPPDYTYKNCHVTMKSEFGYESQCEVYWQGADKGVFCYMLSELDPPDFDPHKKATRNLRQVIRDKIKQQVEEKYKYKPTGYRIYYRSSPTVGVRGNPLADPTTSSDYTFDGVMLSTSFPRQHGYTALQAIYQVRYTFKDLDTFIMPFFVEAAKPGDWLEILLNDQHVFERQITRLTPHEPYEATFPLGDAANFEGLITVVVAGTGGVPGSEVFLPQTVTP